MDEAFTEHDRLLLDLWSRGANLLQYEQLVRDVAETGVSVRVLAVNSFYRLVLLNVAAFYNLQCFSKLLRIDNKGGYLGKEVQIKNVWICKPDVGYVPPRESLADLKNRWSRLHATGKSVRKWSELQLLHTQFAQIEPLEPGKESAMSLHAVPKDLLAFIFALVPLPDFARCRRVCRRWNECAERQSVWRAHLDAMVNRSELTRKAFVEMKWDDKDAMSTLRQLKKVPLGEGMCLLPNCFQLRHEHGAVVPADAAELKPKKLKK